MRACVSLRGSLRGVLGLPQGLPLTRNGRSGPQRPWQGNIFNPGSVEPFLGQTGQDPHWLARLLHQPQV